MLARYLSSAAMLPAAAVVAVAALSAAVIETRAQARDVANNAELRTISSRAGQVIRRGHTTEGDAPPQLYVASSRPCARGNGRGDGGFEVGTADNRCWLIAEQQSYDVRQFGVSDRRTGAENSAGLATIFSDPGSHIFTIPEGTFALACDRYFRAAGSVSLVGSGRESSVLKMEKPCPAIDRAVMNWTSKSNVRLSGWALDLNGSNFSGLRSVLEFLAYQGDTKNLSVTQMAVVNGNAPSLQIAVGASGGHSYSGVVIEDNVLRMTPGDKQNQCIALTTVNGLGYIPSARISRNRCVGSAIQIDGTDTIVTANDVSAFRFGQGIFTAYTTGQPIIRATWANAIATIHHRRGDNPLAVPGQTVHVWGVEPAAYNGAFEVAAATRDSISLRMDRNPGAMTRAGTISPRASNSGCKIDGNVIHDTTQTLDSNTTPPGGIENNCVNSVVSNNRAFNLGGAGFFNFASGATYVGNVAMNVGFLGKGSSGGEADSAAFVVFDNNSGMSWYQSQGVVFENNRSGVSQSATRPRFGYYEEPWHVFSSTLRANDLRGMQTRLLVQPRSSTRVEQ